MRKIHETLSCASADQSKLVTKIKSTQTDTTLKSAEFIQLIVGQLAMTRATSVKSPKTLLTACAKREIPLSKLHTAIEAAYAECEANGKIKPVEPVKTPKAKAPKTTKAPTEKKAPAKRGRKPKRTLDIEALTALFPAHFAAPATPAAKKPGRPRKAAPAVVLQITDRTPYSLPLFRELADAA